MKFEVMKFLSDQNSSCYEFINSAEEHGYITSEQARIARNNLRRMLSQSFDCNPAIGHYILRRSHDVVRFLNSREGRNLDPKEIYANFTKCIDKRQR